MGRLAGRWPSHSVALELVSLDLFLIMLAGGAVVGGITALLGGPVAAPDRARAGHVGRAARGGPARASYAACTAGPTLHTGADALIGKRAMVLRELVHGSRAG